MVSGEKGRHLPPRHADIYRCPQENSAKKHKNVFPPSVPKTYSSTLQLMACC